MKRVLIGILIFLLWVACVVALAFVLHFSGAKFALFCIVLGLVGGAAIAFAVWYLAKMSGENPQSGSGAPDSINLDALLRDAERKLRTSRLGIKSLAAAPILYILGDENAAKTQTVLQSGLDAELLSGNVFRDGNVAPTQLANVWLAGSTVIVEAGGVLLRQPALWLRLVRATQPGKLGTAFSKGSRQPTRAVVLCVSIERLPGATEPGYNDDQARTLAQTMNERLRQLSQTLGIALPVYVLFTKLDTLPHFADYAARLSTDEVNLPLGSLLAPIESGSGLYAERAASLVSSRFDELAFGLSEFRADVLSRGGELDRLASAYEFPRDLQKRRGSIVDFLVELTRPSQLGINPFLRGFFFSGLRKSVVEESATDIPSYEEHRPDNGDQSATVVFRPGDLLARQRQQQQPVRSRSKQVLQWVFLPHLFSKLLLNDNSALEASRSSTKVNLLKRILWAAACSCIFLYLVLLTISFFNNRDLAQQVATAAAVPLSGVPPGQLASAQDIKSLDQLGALLLQLDSNRKGTPPLMYRWGLYNDALFPIACNAYSTKFRTLLLSGTQGNILTQLRSVQSPPPPEADYNSTYKPLKAYLITTSNPEKSTLDFLPPVLMSAWAGTTVPPSELSHLAQTQFETYASLLTEPASCMASTGGRPELATVTRAQIYLNGFSGIQHVYNSMISAANRVSPAVSYNDKFPGSARYILDAVKVPGAFTKPGFAFMQNAIQHPEPYFSGEEWVLGPQAAGNLDRSTLPSQLQKQYIADYLKAWRDYLSAARFAGFQNWNDAAGKLSALDSNVSPLLELFSPISINTGGALSDISNPFQAPQSVVPPSNPDDRFFAASNQPYIQALQGLEQAVKNYTQNPLSANDPNATGPIITAAGMADQAAENLRNSFNPDPTGKMDVTSFNLLEAPIKSIEALTKTGPATAANGAGADFCGKARPVLEKFPFNPSAEAQASPDDAAQIFAPGQGALAQLTAKLNQFIALKNGQYIQNPASAVAIRPEFLSFLNAADKVSKGLFPFGSQPTLSFTLTEVKGAGYPDAVLNIDGTQLTGVGQTASFHWVSQSSSRIILTSQQNSAPPMTGPWSVFKLGFDATHVPPNHLEYPFQFAGHINQVVHFDVDGQGAQLLDPHFMSRVSRCVATVAKQ